MSAKGNMAPVRRAFEEGWNGVNLDLSEVVDAPDHVLHETSVLENVVGIDGIKGFASMFLKACPGICR